MNEKIKSGIWAIAVIVIIVVLITFVVKPRQTEVLSDKVSKKEVTMLADDGVELSADLYQPTGANKNETRKYPGVILLSPFGESRDIYADIAAELCRNDFVVLSVDVRNSGKSQLNNESIAESISKLGIDADTAVYYMYEQTSVLQDKIAILGTQITARSALMVSSFSNKIKGAILVSAVMDSAGFKVLRESPDCPVLILVSIQDAIAASQAVEVYQASQNNLTKIESYINAGSGSDLWRAPTRMEMTSHIINWLTEVLKETGNS